MIECYILDGHTPVLADTKTWARWLEENRNKRQVAKTQVGSQNVSTVFLGLNHALDDGPPLIFETMIFGGPRDCDYQERYSTWEEAEAGHAVAVEIAKKAMT